jgi:hypothetical protein
MMDCVPVMRHSWLSLRIAVAGESAAPNAELTKIAPESSHPPAGFVD